MSGDPGARILVLVEASIQGRSIPKEVLVNETLALEPIPLDQLARWGWVPVVLLLMIYLIGFDQGTLSQTGSFLHELMHDGRHLLGVPCH